MHKCQECWSLCRPVTFIFSIFVSLSKNFTNARQDLLAILQWNITSLYNFQYFVPFYQSNTQKGFQCSVIYLLAELYHVAKIKCNHGKVWRNIKMSCSHELRVNCHDIHLSRRYCNTCDCCIHYIYKANSPVTWEFVTTSKSACNPFSLASF